MDISEKKIEEVAIEMQKLGLINTGPTAFKRMLEAINITGKDGLLDVLETLLRVTDPRMTEPEESLRGTEAEIDARRAAVAHLSQWRQK